VADESDENMKFAESFGIMFVPAFVKINDDGSFQLVKKEELI